MWSLNFIVWLIPKKELVCKGKEIFSFKYVLTDSRNDDLTCRVLFAAYN